MKKKKADLRNEALLKNYLNKTNDTKLHQQQQEDIPAEKQRQTNRAKKV